jgi:hypothetical protein
MFFRLPLFPLHRYKSSTNISQCSIPAFTGIFPSEAHDSVIQELLFACCEWHSLAKLRLHTDVTLSLLEKATKILGERLRHFVADVCPAYRTMETDREYYGRKRRERRLAEQQGRALEGSNAGVQRVCFSGKFSHLHPERHAPRKNLDIGHLQIPCAGGLSRHCYKVRYHGLLYLRNRAFFSSSSDPS